MGVVEVTQLLQRLGLDLADALPGHPEHLSYLFERMLRRSPDAEAQNQDALFARRQLAESASHDPLERTCLRGRMRIDRIGRLDEVAQRRVAVLADRNVERSRLLHHR